MVDAAKKAKNARVSAKIKILRDEGDPQNQAVAKALSMERAGRLGPNGEYRHVGSKRGGARGGGRR